MLPYRILGCYAPNLDGYGMAMLRKGTPLTRYCFGSCTHWAKAHWSGKDTVAGIWWPTFSREMILKFVMRSDGCYEVRWMEKREET